MTMRTKVYRYEPDYAVPPGETLAEAIEAIGISQAELARRSGLTRKHINRVITGHAPLSADTAIRLERVTGVGSTVWAALEANYRTHVKRAQELAALRPQADWLKSIPVRALASRGALEHARDSAVMLDRVLGFFGVSSLAAWRIEWESPRAIFRRSQSAVAHPGAVAAWIRLGEMQARRMACSAYSEAKFRHALACARTLTSARPSAFFGRLQSLCADSGVALVLVPELPKAPVRGAARWLGPSNKAMIALSPRFATSDAFWFSFFHEAGHVIMHSRRDGFVDTPEGHLKDHLESEADAFAARLLIPQDCEHELPSLHTAHAVKRFAAAIGVHPGIVVGRLQHERIVPRSALNHLKIRLDWSALRKTALVLEAQGRISTAAGLGRHPRLR